MYEIIYRKIPQRGFVYRKKREKRGKIIEKKGKKIEKRVDIEGRGVVI